MKIHSLKKLHLPQTNSFAKSLSHKKDEFDLTTTRKALFKVNEREHFSHTEFFVDISSNDSNTIRPWWTQDLKNLLPPLADFASHKKNSERLFRLLKTRARANNYLNV